MRNLVTVLCILLSTSLLFGEVYHNAKLETNIQNRERVFIEKDSFSLTNSTSSPLPNYSSRDGQFTTVLIDSSKNGYGMYSNNTNPIVYVPGTGVAACYRQWQGIDASAGYIGVAQSPDGVIWEVASSLNNLYPGGTTPDGAGGLPAGRYPSMVGTANSYPTAIWNEYTTTTGGGTNGGRAMNAFNEYGWVGSNFSELWDLNTGCAMTPCDPPDLWVGQAQVVEEATGPTLLALFGEGLGPDQYWMLRSSYHIFGYYGMANPVMVFDKTTHFAGDEVSNYTGTPEFHINDDGVGYMVNSGYWHDYETGGSIVNHTLFYKKTTDYGLTWENTGGIENTGFYGWSDIQFNQMMLDAGLLGDSISTVVGEDTTWNMLDEAFAGYDYDVKVDANGGLHISTVVVATFQSASGVYTGMPGAGHYYFYNPTPDDVNTWTATQIRDMSTSFLFDFGSFSGWQYHSPDMAISNNDDGSVTIWCVTAAVSDTSEDATSIYMNDIDVYLAVTSDYGQTWEDLGNMTNTPSVGDVDYYELSPHLAPIATHDICYLIFQSPDFSVLTVDTDENYEDYKQRVYVGSYNRGPVSTDSEITTPVEFSLSQNYPNPFNPTTEIEYSLSVAGHVKLELYNVLGQKMMMLVDEHQIAGVHDYILDASALPSGVYVYSLTQNGVTKTSKMVLMK